MTTVNKGITIQNLKLSMFKAPWWFKILEIFEIGSSCHITLIFLLMFKAKVDLELGAFLELRSWQDLSLDGYLSTKLDPSNTIDTTPIQRDWFPKCPTPIVILDSTMPIISKVLKPKVRTQWCPHFCIHTACSTRH